MRNNNDWRSAAVQIWEYLIVNVDKENLFCSTVGDHIGIYSRNINYPLAYILEFCERNQLPSLCGLVIKKNPYTNKNKKIPGGRFRIKKKDKYVFPHEDGFRTLYDEELKLIRSFDWSNVKFEPCDCNYSCLKRYLYNQLSLRGRPSDCATLLGLSKKQVG